MSPLTELDTSVSLDAASPVLFLSDLHFGDGTEETEPRDLFRWWKQHHKGFLRFDL